MSIKQSDDKWKRASLFRVPRIQPRNLEAQNKEIQWQKELVQYRKEIKHNQRMRRRKERKAFKERVLKDYGMWDEEQEKAAEIKKHKDKYK